MKRKCAVCGDTCQTNVRFKWQRFSDNKVFHVCGLCAESGKVNADSVHEEVTKTYTTVDSEYQAEDNDGMMRRRATMSSYYRNGSAFAKARTR